MCGGLAVPSVRLKGLNKVTVRLADRRVVTYRYAWKGGPRLPGKPGDPEFIAAFMDVAAQRKGHRRTRWPASSLATKPPRNSAG
jgi:hypothetical protein